MEQVEEETKEIVENILIVKIIAVFIECSLPPLM